MKSIIIVTMILASSVAFAQAQQTEQRPSDAEIAARIQALTAQRNTANDQVVYLAAKNSILEEQLSQLEKKAAVSGDKTPKKEK